ncbi:MAG: hypothetical protein NTX22_16910 [Ignavibacteriales bacterium]|nr:hypothetical protein [Ignavibacteriales bacterium]
MKSNYSRNIFDENEFFAFRISDDGKIVRCWRGNKDLSLIRERIQNNFYDNEEIIDYIATQILSDLKL